MTMVILAGFGLLPSSSLLAAGKNELRVTLRVELGRDAGQPFGTLWEATNAEGRPLAGAGFLNAYNTQDRSDRRMLHVYVRTDGADKFTLERLPRPTTDAGTYLFGFDGKLFAKGRNALDSKLRVWRPDTQRWEVDDQTVPFGVQVAGEVMAATARRVTFGNRTVLELAPGQGSIGEWYYAAGRLIVRRYDAEATPPVNELLAFVWQPPQREGLVLERGVKLPFIYPREFIYAFGPQGDDMVAASNMGGVHVFDGRSWRTVRAPDGKSFQIYSTLNTANRLLLGQYPTGELFEVTGGELRRLADWPPVMKGVSRNAREAQTLAIYGGDIYVGVWPWGEVWRRDGADLTWRFMGRMFTHPEPTDKTTHPYEEETKQLDPVLNRWGQRVTSMVPLGDSLYIATSAKGPNPYEPTFTFLAGDKHLDYGAVYRYRKPGCLAVPIIWKDGPTTLDFIVEKGRMRVFQDGEELGVGSVEGKLPPQLTKGRLIWGSGLYGPFVGKIVSRRASGLIAFGGAVAPAERDGLLPGAKSARPSGARELQLQGVWVEPGGIALVAKEPLRTTLERVTRESVRAMHEVGATTLILAYAEQGGVFYYPSTIEFYDLDLKRIVNGADCRFDVYGTVLDEADRLGLHVFLGLGRSGDTLLLWEFDKPGWPERNERALQLGRRVAKELYEKYSRHQSFHGWYLTHEMNDLAKASAYYDPMADYCHELAPGKPVLVAPAGTPIITKELLTRSKVDIFAYQDAVGAGYVPYENTYQPDRRLATLSNVYRQYAQWHVGTGKRIWSDLEIWEMDGRQGYSGAFPAAFDRIKQQMEIEAPHVEMLSLYAWHGYMQDPKSTAEKANPKAQALFTAYREWAKRGRVESTSLPRPFRGAYVHLERHLDPRQTPAEHEKILREELDRMQAFGINAVMPFVSSSSGQAYYDSTIVPDKLYGRNDPVQLLVREARARGIGVYPVVPVAVCGHKNPAGILLQHPEWALRDTDGQSLGFISPAHPEARQWLVSVIREIVAKYHPDGIVLDYLRYENRPLRLDPAAEERFRTSLPPDCLPAEEKKHWQQFKETELTELVRQISEGARAEQPGVTLAAYVWGAHVAQNHQIAQVWPLWVERGYLDMVNISGYYHHDKYGEKYLTKFEEQMSAALEINRRLPRPAAMTFALGVITSHGRVHSAGDIRKYLEAADRLKMDGVVYFTWEYLRPFLEELNSATK